MRGQRVTLLPVVSANMPGTGQIRVADRRQARTAQTVSDPASLDAIRSASDASGRPFVGRDREFAELRAGLEEAFAGRGRLFLITGEPGIGKTRLAEEFSALAQERGASVLWGRCWEGGGAPAYWPWVQMIRSYVRQRHSTALAEEIGSIDSHLARLVPELRRSHAHSPPPNLEGEEARFALFDATTEFLRSVAAHAPIVVVLDDLHAADRSSLLLLRFVASALRESRILVLGTYREIQARLVHGTAEILGELARESSRVPLDGLALEDVRRFVERRAGRADGPGLAEEVYRITEGNPFFVEEVLRLLQAEHSQDAPRSVSRVPPAVGEAIRCRLGLLSEEANRLLSIASVIGRDFDVAVLGTASGFPSSERLLELLTEAAAAGIVRRVPGVLGRSGFAHALFRETVYEALPLPERSRRHGEVARAIEDVHRADPTPHVAELAHHFHQAALGGGERRPAIDYARRAGERAIAMFAYEEAVEHYERAIELSRLEKPNPARIADLLLSLGDAQRRAGDVCSAGKTFLDAVELARRIGSAERLARAALGYGARSLTRSTIRPANDAAIGLLCEADAALGNRDSALRAHVLARLAMELLWTEDADRREAISREAVEIARRVGDRATLLVALHIRVVAIWGPETVAERLAIADEMAPIAGALHDSEMRYLAHQIRFRTMMQLGEVQGAERDRAECDRLSEELRVRFYRMHQAVARVSRTIWSGHLDHAEGVATQILALVPPEDRDGSTVASLIRLIRWVEGRFEELVPHLEAQVGLFPDAPVPRALLAMTYVELGRDAEAKRELDRLDANGFARLRKDHHWLVAMFFLSRACSRLRQRDRAAILYDLLEPYAAQNVTGLVMSDFGAVAGVLAALAATMSRWADAARHFEAALERNRLSGNLPLTALTLRDYAEMLASRGDPGDATRALALVEEALEIMRSIGMHGYVPRTEEIRRRIGASTHSVEERAALRRDGDFWLLTFAGESQRLRELKGVHYLAYLLARPNQVCHVLEVISGSEEVDFAAWAAVGGAGPLLDTKAKIAYRRRLSELRADLEEARARGDCDRAAMAEEEIEGLARELSRAVGLRGRDRQAGDSTERARVNVVRRINAVVEQVMQTSPTLGIHLRQAIRTGMFCTYLPGSNSSVACRL